MNARVSRRANADLIAIWDYIAHDSVVTAHKVIAEIESAIESLTLFPGMGHPRADCRHPSYLFWPVYSFLVVYRVNSKELIVVRVIDGRRNIARVLK